MGKQIFLSSRFPYLEFKTDLRVDFGIHRHKTNQNQAKHIKGLLLQQKNAQIIQDRHLEYMHVQFWYRQLKPKNYQYLSTAPILEAYWNEIWTPKLFHHWDYSKWQKQKSIYTLAGILLHSNQNKTP